MIWKSAFAAAALAAGALAVTGAHAQEDYPTKPITMIVSFAAGGSTDVVVRTVANKMSDILGQPIVVENRGGADGNVAAEHAAELAPDGYSVLATTNAITINLNLYDQSYHPEEDFDPVVQLGDGPNVVVVHPSVEAETLEELVALSKEEPLFFATTASITWLATELFNKSTGVEAERIPYTGAGTAVPALLGGEVDMMLTGIINALPHIEAGNLRPIVVTGQERSDALPETASIGEFGMEDYDDAVWYGLFVPDGTPEAIVDKLNAAAREALEDPEVQARLSELTVRTMDTTPEEFAQTIHDDIAKWEQLIEETGASLD